jgi:hypothetical protein
MTMKRRDIIALLGSAAAWPLSSRAITWHQDYPARRAYRR